MSSLRDEMMRAKYYGDEIVSHFLGEVRSINETALRVNDVLCMPADYDGKVVNTRLPDGNLSQSIFVETETGETRRLYVSQFDRIVKDIDGGLHTSHGSAVEKFRQYISHHDAMNALRGTKIRVSNIQRIPIKSRFGRRFNSVYTFDLV